MNPEARIRISESVSVIRGGGVLLQVVAVLAPLYVANILVTKLGGGSLRAGLWIGTPA
jgi:hypothetical protein